MAQRDAERAKKLFEKYKPTHVIHLAALGMSSAPVPQPRSVVHSS